MEILYASKKLETQCTDVSAAKKLFGGSKALAISLIARVVFLKKALTIKDVIAMPSLHFHKLDNKNRKNLEGYFAIDAKSRKEPWRIILQPLDEKKPYPHCSIDKIAKYVRVIAISEVSKHYE